MDEVKEVSHFSFKLGTKNRVENDIMLKIILSDALTFSEVNTSQALLTCYKYFCSGHEESRNMLRCEKKIFPLRKISNS